MAILEREITTRAYELDRFGRIPPAVLLRYLEHTRWEAGYDSETEMSGLFAGGRRMVVRAQQLRMMRALGRAERLRVSLWLEGVGRTSMTMGQRVVLAEGGEEVAVGTVVGVSIDERGQPTALGAAVRELTRPAGLSHARIDAGAAPAGAFQASTVVRYSDTDLLQHANHARYADWVEDARAAASAAGALGQAGPPRRARWLAVENLRECLVGDTVEMAVWRADDGAVRVDGRVGPGRELSFRAAVDDSPPGER